MTNDLRILYVEEAELGTLLHSELERELFCKIDWETCGKNVALDRDPLKYNVAIIDASDDYMPEGEHTLSEWLKSRNPELIIIGISGCGINFDKDPLSRQLYDERIAKGYMNFFPKMKEALKKYGFEFPETVEVAK